MKPRTVEVTLRFESSATLAALRRGAWASLAFGLERHFMAGRSIAWLRGQPITKFLGMPVKVVKARRVK